MKVTIIKDSDSISTDFVYKYDLAARGLVKASSSGHEWFSTFVGIVISASGDSALISTPKHFMSDGDSSINSAHTIIRTLMHYKADVIPNFRGSKEAVVANLPINDLKIIADYLNRFGLYMEETFTTKRGIGKNVVWKKSIQHSNAIYSNDDLVLLPLIFKENMRIENIVTVAMRYVLENYHDLFSLLNINTRSFVRKDVHRTNNRYAKQLIKKLREQLSITHQDKEISLINSLINVLKLSGSAASYYLTTTNFDVIWESIVLNYLNNNFSGVINNKPTFKKHTPQYLFESQRPFTIDTKNNRVIRPDYYLNTDTIQLIFDAKYYTKINDLNYKQLVYGILLGDRQSSRQKLTINALFVPTSGDAPVNNIHTNINKEFLPTINRQIIRTIYLNMNQAMTEYIS